MGQRKVPKRLNSKPEGKIVRPLVLYSVSEVQEENSRNQVEISINAASSASVPYAESEVRKKSHSQQDVTSDNPCSIDSYLTLTTEVPEKTSSKPVDNVFGEWSSGSVPYVEGETPENLGSKPQVTGFKPWLIESCSSETPSGKLPVTSFRPSFSDSVPYVKNKIPQKLRSKGVTSYNPCHIESRSGPVIKVSDESSFDEESDKISQPWLEKSAPKNKDVQSSSKNKAYETTGKRQRVEDEESVEYTCSFKRVKVLKEKDPGDKPTLRKSIKHRKKLQSLQEMEEDKLTKLGSPLKRIVCHKNFKLGKGSNGTSVYLGILEDGSEVAVKRMLIESCEDAAENEMKILNYMKKNKSPFIVNYRHFLKDDTFLYLIVDLCEQTLYQHVHSKDIEYLQEHGRQIVKEVIAGLKFLHDERILHRDLKPSNVLVDVDGHMRLADFGISRVLNEGETTIHTDTKGTEGWMAAEVIENMSKKMKGRFKKKSDIQSAGMIAFFILTKGEHPFGCTLYDRMANIVKGNPVNLNKLDIDARQFVSRLISRNIHDRPTAQEAMLLPFLNGID